MNINQLLKDIYHFSSATDIEIHGLALDSRLVKPGDLFFAYQGTHLDGRKFIDDAIKKGARAVLTDTNKISAIQWQDSIPIFHIQQLQQKMGEIAARFYAYPAKLMTMIGMTGTNGKTSCSHFIASALQQVHIPCGVIGTLGSGLYGDIKPGNLTTPDAVTLQKTLAELHAKGAKAISMEVSSHSLEQSRINGIEFEVGIFTNLTRDHLDYHGTMEAYGAAKKRLFDYAKFAVINADDAFGKQMLASLATRKNVFSYGTSRVNAPLVYTEQIHLDISGIRAHVFTPWGEGDLHTKLIGQFNLSNVLATLTALCLLKISFQDVLNCVSRLSSVPGRMQALGGGAQPLVVVDYAHTPDALEKVLIALKRHCHGKLHCLFGCGGDRDRGKRPMMAKIAEQYADHVVVTDDNPRTENPGQIVADIMQGFSNPTSIIVQHDRSKAIRNVIQYAKAGDCVLIAGKGAEEYQQIGNEKIPFSDVEKVRETINAGLVQ